MWRKILPSHPASSLFNTAVQKSEGELLLEGTLPSNDGLVTGSVMKKMCQSSALLAFGAFCCFEERLGLLVQADL